jgi:hypothetical protein
LYVWFAVIDSPVPPVRTTTTTTTTTTTFVLRKEGILGFWYLMDVHHLNRSLPFGFTWVNTQTQIESAIQHKHHNNIEPRKIVETKKSK